MEKKSASGVSIAIKNTMASYLSGAALLEKANSSEFTIKIANTLEEREAVYNLGYKVYLEKGFVNENSSEWLIQNYDANNETVILIVQDKFKNIAGSVTLVFDGNSRLPAEKIYPDELKALRESGNKMVELSRLVINPSYRNSKEILVLLFNYLAIYIYHVKSYNSITIQVNPRHKNYYKLLLGFTEVGVEKPCPHVQNAPAVLLFLSTTLYRSELRRCAKAKNTDKKDRSLYPFFIKAEQENLVAYYLAKQIKPMSAEEKLYFGLAHSGSGQAVAV